MDKLKELFNFIKSNLHGETTKSVILIIFVLLMHKIFGLIGIVASIILAIAIDLCGTTNLKEIYIFLKNKFFPLALICILLVACRTSKETNNNNNIYSVSQMSIISKDTITSTKYREMVVKKEIPSLAKFAKTYLKNTEENRTNAYYAYYDSISFKLYNVKELIINRDTLYIVEKKVVK